MDTYAFPQNWHHVSENIAITHIILTHLSFHSKLNYRVLVLKW